MKLLLPQEKVQSITQLPVADETVNCHNPSAVSIAGKDDSSSSSSPVNPNTAPSSSTLEDTITQATEVIQTAGDPGREDSGGTAVVVSPSNHMEWERHHTSTLDLVIETDASLLG